MPQLEDVRHPRCTAFFSLLVIGLNGLYFTILKGGKTDENYPLLLGPLPKSTQMYSKAKVLLTIISPKL